MLAWNDSESGLNAVDALNLLALFLLAVVVAFFRRQLGEEAFWVLGVFACLSIFVLAAAGGVTADRWRPQRPAVRGDEAIRGASRHTLRRERSPQNRSDA